MKLWLSGSHRVKLLFLFSYDRNYRFPFCYYQWLFWFYKLCIGGNNRSVQLFVRWFSASLKPLIFMQDSIDQCTYGTIRFCLASTFVSFIEKSWVNKTFCYFSKLVLQLKTFTNNCSTNWGGCFFFFLVRSYCCLSYPLFKILLLYTFFRIHRF